MAIFLVPPTDTFSHGFWLINSVSCIFVIVFVVSVLPTYRHTYTNSLFNTFNSPISLSFPQTHTKASILNLLITQFLVQSFTLHYIYILLVLPWFSYFSFHVTFYTQFISTCYMSNWFLIQCHWPIYKPATHLAPPTSPFSAYNWAAYKPHSLSSSLWSVDAREG